MKKIAFINVRYGAGINGGSEVHCRMLAERLRDKYDVEVLTTTLKDFNNPSDQYPAGESHESGITIRRFVPHPGFNGRESRRLLQKSKPVRRLRYWLSQAGVLRLLAAIHPIWNLGFDKETAYQHSTVSYAPTCCATSKNIGTIMRHSFPCAISMHRPFSQGCRFPKKAY